MSQIETMLRVHPWPSRVDRGLLAEGIAECFNCAQVCTACGDACLGEDNVNELVRCIRLDLDCADVCTATGQLLSRLTQADDLLLSSQLQACATACQLCGLECQKYADHHEHCRICAEACQRCGQVCNNLLIALPQVANA